MPKLVPLLVVAALGGAMLLSAGAPYEMAARNIEINRTPAAEIIKIRASQDAMFETLDQPTLPPGMSIVMPNDRGTPSYYVARARPA